MRKRLLSAALLLLAAFGARAMSVPISPQMMRFSSSWTANGENFDGVARIFYDNDGSVTDGSWRLCSGTLLSGGQYILTAAHCADDFNVMEIQFGVNNNVATATRGAASATVHPNWDGTLKHGNDIALIKLDSAVSTIQPFRLSTTNDVGKLMMMMGYGRTTNGWSDAAPSWGDGAWGHWGINTFDTTTQRFMSAVTAAGIDDTGLGTWGNSDGEEYVADYDNGTDLNNTLGRIPRIRILHLLGGETVELNLGPALNSGTGVSFESLIAPGDSGGGDFIWTGTEWLLSGVHSWGWEFCQGRIDPSCDFSTTNSSSYGDLMGSTAVFSHVDWINSIIGSREFRRLERPLNPNDVNLTLLMTVPEPGSLALALPGLLAIFLLPGRRRFRREA